MKTIFFFLIASALVFLHLNTKAQNFVNGGNNLPATGRLGTTSNQSLAFITNNSERGRVTNAGNWAFGLSGPTARVHINGASGANALQVAVNGTTKLLVHSGGGLAIGNSSTPPPNGLFVSGNVGIGTNVPAYKLHILTANAITAYHGNTFAGSSDHTGTYSSSVNAAGYGFGSQSVGGFFGSYNVGQGSDYEGGVHGVYGTASGVTGSCFGYRYGVEGFASGGIANYGVFGSTYDECGTAFDAAGYFSGDVYAANYFSSSDRKFKKEIIPLKNAMQQLMKLKPSAYTFKTTEYPKMGLAPGNQLGLIADEVKQVFPELVKETVSPAQYNKDKVLVTPSEKYESVNYIGLIPVLIASVQEQQSTIADLNIANEKLKADNEDLKVRLTKLEQAMHLNNDAIALSSSSASISQNSPNPFSGNTIINYYLPEQSKRAFVNISDINGRIIKRVQLTQNGNGQLVLPAGQFTTGSYQYSLLVDGRVVDTKKMVLTSK